MYICIYIVNKKPDEMKAKKLQIQQLDRRIKHLHKAQEASKMTYGWIRTIRQALGMSLQQLAKKMYMTKQNLSDIERREVENSVSLKTLRQAADALDMDLVYGFVPREGSLEKYIHKKAESLAKEIVIRSSQNMALEGQESSERRISQSIKERTEAFQNELPKILWD